MSLSDFAPVSLADVRADLDLNGTGKDPLLERFINRAFVMVEEYLGRQLVTRGPQTERHTPEGDSVLYLLDWPVIEVTSVHESSVQTYDADSLLTVSDYGVNKARGKLTRLFSGSPGAWLCGYRTVQVVYSFGYATAADVPEDIRGVVLDVVKRKWRDNKNGGMLSVSDQTGTVTRFLPSELLRMEREVLDFHRKQTFAGGQSGERDEDVVST